MIMLQVLDYKIHFMQQKTGALSVVLYDTWLGWSRLLARVMTTWPQGAVPCQAFTYFIWTKFIAWLVPEMPQ